MQSLNGGAMDDSAALTKTQTTPKAKQRFFDCEDKTVFDSKNQLIWLKNDTWQMTGKWMNWVQSRDYALELNRQQFAGYTNWRLPTPAEAKSLYDKSRGSKDYTGKTSWLHPIFPEGYSFLCWTSEVKNKVQGVRFGYRKGGIMFDNIYRLSRGATRFVRSREKNV